MAARVATAARAARAATAEAQGLIQLSYLLFPVSHNLCFLNPLSIQQDMGLRLELRRGHHNQQRRHGEPQGRLQERCHARLFRAATVTVTSTPMITNCSSVARPRKPGHCQLRSRDHQSQRRGPDRYDRPRQQQQRGEPGQSPAPTRRRPSKVKLSAAATAEKRRRKRNAELRLEVARSELKKAYKVYKALN